ncbi:MAG: hypothetical protein JNM19_02315 [Chitinophagaceae bacterium]|nr:hypothetical protein [Chitinophagaceae bacterium]
MKLIGTIILLFFFTAINAVTRYVSPAGAGLMNGTSWNNAFPGTSLQAAINASVPGDEVWVMSGTYLTTTTVSRNIFFSMLNGVAVYGSFNGTETLLSQRTFSCGFSSVLSAEIGLPGNADNSYHVIGNSSLNNTSILDGFTITGGNANFDLLGNDSRSLGGGMFNNAANGGTCSPTIRNCLFINNTAVFGGGIFDHGQNGGNASPVITNCIFAFNTATGGGGGIDNFGYNGNASPFITNCIFYSNTATDRAGAMYCWGGGNGNASPTILHSVFLNNSSVDGGGIVSDRTNFVSGNSGTANPTIRNSVFWGNTASGTGPQFYILGAASFTVSYSVIDISNQNPPHTISGAGTGNIYTAPSFLNSADADGTDNCWLTSDDGLQLQNGSPGIDAGDNTGVPSFDIRGNTRVINGVADIGAYEFNTTVLPVVLLRFYGNAYNAANLLVWTTATETGTRVFEVYRGTDAQYFEKIGEVAAGGNSTGFREYQFTDDKLYANSYFYRLKLIDLNGQHSFSRIISLSGNKTGNAVTVMPNPVVNKAVILFQQQVFVNEEFALLSSNGQMIDRLFFNGATGELDLTGMASGLYLLVNKRSGSVIKIFKAAR